MKAILTPDMKLSEMIDINFGLVHVLPRIGLELRQAGLKAKDACSQAGIDPATFLLVCNVYSFADYVPSKEEMSSVNVSDIIRYLHGSHSLYTGTMLGTLEKEFDNLVEPCDERQRRAILKFYFDYKDELEKHFAREEKEVFPYIKSLQEGQRSGSYSIDDFEDSHESVDEKLQDMKNIVMMYLPAVCDEQARFSVLMTICHLQEDLRRHTYVEDNILVPLVRNLEADGRR